MANKGGGWIKKFYDKNVEYGLDDLIKDKKASWSRGRLDGIETVFLFNESSPIQYCLSVPGTEWHQFDRFHSIVDRTGEIMFHRAARVIQAKILDDHIGMALNKIKTQKSPGLFVYHFLLEPVKQGHGVENLLTISAVDKWVSLVLLPDNKCAVQLCERGKIKWQAVHI